MSIVHWNKINKVNLKFCNNGFDEKDLSPSLDIKIRPNQKKEICVVLLNETNEELIINSSVFQWTLNSLWNIICSDSDRLTWDFLLNNFDMFSWDISLLPNQKIVRYFTLYASDNASWQYYSCFSVNLKESERLSSNSPFWLLIRKAANIKITVSWKPYNFQWFDDIISSLENYNRQIWIAWVSIFGVLFVYVLFNMSKKDKKANLKSRKASHKK